MKNKTPTLIIDYLDKRFGTNNMNILLWTTHLGRPFEEHCFITCLFVLFQFLSDFGYIASTCWTLMYFVDVCLQVHRINWYAI